MKIITFTAIKGGVGKTTLTFNYASWLAKHDKKVLLIDLDHQCNLTTLFQTTRKNNTIAEVFKDEEVAEDIIIDKVGENIDLISGYIDLDELSTQLENDNNKAMLLYLWLRKNMDKYQFEQYDYILIDTHPDFGTITKNAISVSDYLVSPITPSKHGYDAKFDLFGRLEKYRKTVFNYATGETYIDAKLYFVANMVKYNTKISRDLIEHIKDEDDVLGYINEKELFNKASVNRCSIFDLEEDKEVYKKNKSFYDSINTVFETITTKLNED
ncbi:ParA family protein [Lactococcus lactis]|uniref:ParA family protein n=1 Tax=Lactococcus lactis TaxID=1358 RepID=A0AB35KFK1_9LACT|nr:ParA family protein [Lactococcus lactis]MDG5049926.1 ParA family protein [Lactococcus lactis]MDT2914508.1 ParA family protein [Lactococcus lactis]MDT2938644.1 ParA family protein [Lactococcus lactis]